MSLADTTEPVMLLAVPGNDLFISNCCAIALTALIFYDFSITVNDEIRCIWKRKFSGASFLFLANRYVGLLYRLVTLFLLLPWSTKARGSADEVCSCTSIFRLSEVLGLILEVVYAGITSFRVYAIWRLDKRILFGTMAIGLCLPCLEIVYYTGISLVALQPPYSGCGIIVDGDTSQLKFGVTIRALAMLLHTLVLVLTWIRTSNVNTFLSHWNFNSSLSLLLLRDGALYFVVLVVLNVIDLIEIIRSGGLMNPVSTIVITSILMSRFMLNLRDVDMQGVQVWSSHMKPASEIRFASESNMVGNLGAPLDIGEVGRLGSTTGGSERASMVSMRGDIAARGDTFVVSLVDEALLDEGEDVQSKDDLRYGGDEDFKETY